MVNSKILISLVLVNETAKNKISMQMIISGKLINFKLDDIKNVRSLQNSIIFLHQNSVMLDCDYMTPEKMHYHQTTNLLRFKLSSTLLSAEIVRYIDDKYKVAIKGTSN